MTDLAAALLAAERPAARPAPLPPRSLFTTSRDGLRLHARVYGPEGARALPVVCLPGLARTARDFEEIAPALAEDDERPRRVLAFDYRGRGLSDYDPDWKHYDLKLELDDIQQQLAALGVEHAVFIGTSRGGLLTMALGAARPALVRGAVFNDIGPVIEAAGLMRIRGYVGKLPAPHSYAEGAEMLKRLFGPQFTAFTATDWDGMAERTWKEARGRLVPDYDVNLMKTLEELDLEAPLPILWPYFDALAHAPMLAIRGENSDILSPATLREMAVRHPGCDTLTVAGQGHAPLLGSAEVAGRIRRLVARAEAT